MLNHRSSEVLVPIRNALFDSNRPRTIACAPDTALRLTITYLCWIRSKFGESIRPNFLARYAYPEPWLSIASPREATYDGDRHQILDATPSRNETDATRVVLSQGVVRGPFGPLMSYH